MHKHILIIIISSESSSLIESSVSSELSLSYHYYQCESLFHLCLLYLFYLFICFYIIIYMFMISIHYISISLSFNLLIKLQATMNFISLFYLLIDICISSLFSLNNRTVSLRTVGNFCFVTVSLKTNVS